MAEKVLFTFSTEFQRGQEKKEIPRHAKIAESQMDREQTRPRSRSHVAPTKAPTRSVESQGSV